MNLVVVDVSVAAKWFLPGSSEALRDEAFALLDKHDRGGIQFVVPDLFCVEIASAIWKAVRLGRLSKASGLNALELLKQREFPTVPSLKLLDRAFQIAMEYQRTVCDCLYVVLAIDSRTEFLTADERLANVLAAHFPVKWLGAI